MATLTLKREYLVADLAALQQLAQALADRLRGDETIELLSDLGGGKTAFVRYLVAALGGRCSVSSPSFTIENVYQCSKTTVHHFDFYRLTDSGICAHTLSEAILDPQALVIVEWSQLVKDLLPPQRLQIEIIFVDNISEKRRFLFRLPADLKYLMVGL